MRCGVTLRRQEKHPINNVCQLHTGESQNGWARNHEIPNKHSDSDESLENNASCLSLSSTGNIERGLDQPSAPHHRRPEETRFILVQNFYSPNMVYPLRNAMKPIFQVRDCRGSTKLAANPLKRHREFALRRVAKNPQLLPSQRHCYPQAAPLHIRIHSMLHSPPTEKAV